MVAKTHERQLQYLYSPLMTVIILTICCQSSNAYKLSALQHNIEQLNPNLRCPGKNMENIWHPCKYGGYVENPDPKHCADRYVCYVGLNEPCHRRDKCADNAICTVCGICQKCDSADNCSDFDLCPNFFGFSGMNLIKRMMMKKPSLSYVEE